VQNPGEDASLSAKSLGGELMITGSIVLVLVTLVLTVLWWTATTPTLFRRYLRTPARGDRRFWWRAGHHAEHVGRRMSGNEGPTLDSQLAVRWADPALLPHLKAGQ
jgi:hypothetical protein